MNLQQLSRHVRLYARSMALIGEIRLMTQLRKSLLGLFAVGMAIFAIAMINLGLYNALESVWGNVWTPLGIGIANLVIAAIALLVASRLQHGPELRMAEELRDSVAADIESDLQSLRSFQGVGNLIGGTLENGTARLLVPLIGTVLAALRQRKPSSRAK
jgi:hypothetical protein